jgi:hypothetical protein
MADDCLAERYAWELEESEEVKHVPATANSKWLKCRYCIQYFLEMVILQKLKCMHALSKKAKQSKAKQSKEKKRKEKKRKEKKRKEKKRKEKKRKDST